MVWDVTQHFWSFWCQIGPIHRNLITFVVLRCLMFLTSNRCNSLYFDNLCRFALFWMVCDVTQHFCSFWRLIHALHRNLITFVVLRCLMFLTSNRFNSLQFDYFCRFELFWMVWDVTQHFLSFWRQIDAIHRNLITFVVLRCLMFLTSNRCNSLYFDKFCRFALFWMVWDVTQHFCSFWRLIHALPRNLITFVVLRCLMFLTSNRCNSL